jgi:hypothetical protein
VNHAVWRDILRTAASRDSDRRDRRDPRHPAVGSSRNSADFGRGRIDRGTGEADRKEEAATACGQKTAAQAITAQKTGPAEGDEKTASAASATQNPSICRAEAARSQTGTDAETESCSGAETKGEASAAEETENTGRGKNTAGTEAERKPKPKPPPPKPDEFQSLLKNLAKDRRAAEKAKADAPVKVAKQAVETPRRSALQDRRIAAGLSQAINQQITPCWKIQAGARDAANMSVAVNIRLNPDGSLSGVTKIEDTAAARTRPVFPGGRRKCATRPAGPGLYAAEAAIRKLRPLEKHHLHV